MDMSRLEKGRKDEKAHFWLLDELAGTIAGMQKHKKRSIQEVEKWLTPSSEAFARLCYENYCKNVELKHKGEENVTPTKYTHEGRGAKRNQGWSMEGIKRYNILYKIVKDDREENSNTDIAYFDKKKQEVEDSQKERKKAKVVTEREKDWMEAEEDALSVGETY